MRNRLAASFTVLALVVGLVTPALANSKGIPNSNASGYWSQERRNSAIPREFEFEVGGREGKLVPLAKRGGTPGGTTTSGTSYWPSNRQKEFVAEITGKIFFTMKGIDYVCSGSLIEDERADIAVVITAAHCVWENAASGAFATNFSFWPNYDTDHNNRISWSAKLLLAPKAFTDQTSFNTTALLNDFAFAVITSSESRVNPSSLPKLGRLAVNETAYAFGYPQASPFNGLELVYSVGSVSEDPNTSRGTWKLASTLTGGASGGPWYGSYISGNSVGAVSSVNSYKYKSDKNSMYGPKFNETTSRLLAAAITGICPSGPEFSCIALN